MYTYRKKIISKKKGSKQLRKNSLKTQKMKIPYFLNFNKRIEKLVKSFYMKPILFFLIILYFRKHIFFQRESKKFIISNRIGYWNKFEHIKFIEALYLYDCNQLKLKSYIKDRTYSQIRSHGQKFYNKLKSFMDEELGVDFTSPHVKSLKDIVNIVKDKELISNNRNLLYIISEKISFGKSPYKKEINPKNRKTKNANIKNKFVNTNDYINNTNYINNKNDNLIINENLFIDNEERKELTLNSLKYDNLLTLLQDSEDYLENSFDIDNKNYF